MGIDLVRLSQGYIDEDEEIENLRQWGFRVDHYEAKFDSSQNDGDFEGYLEAERQSFIAAHNAAVEVYNRYFKRFSECNSDRSRIQAVREELRLEEVMFENTEAILRIVGKKMDWVSSIFKHEAKAAERNGDEIREMIRQRKEEERRREIEELSKIGGFGMF